MLNAMHAWAVAGSGLSDQKVVWGQQDAPRPEAPAITLRISNLSEMGAPWIDYVAKPLTFADLAISSVDATTNTLTSNGHGRLTGDGPVRAVSTGNLPGGLDEWTDYWVVRVDDDTFQLAATFQDAMSVPVADIVDLTSAGAGGLAVVATSQTARAGEELQAVARGLLRATLELRCHAEPTIGPDMAIAILQRVRSRRNLPSQQAIFEEANISLLDSERVRAIVGTRDDFLFEPRAHLDVHIAIPVEDGEAIGIIERVTGTNLITGRPFDIP
ncbi:MAG: hypothetical protein ACTHU0_01000 [Kofleriaceae bacterium]